MAAAIHDLPVSEFAHLPRFADSAAHVLAELDALPAALFDRPIAAAARDWITAHLPHRPAAVLHGDLLPQNLLCEIGGGAVSVIDWECARIGDPAYDLAVTRGVRKPLQEGGGFELLLALYNESAPIALTTSDVHAYEMLSTSAGSQKRPTRKQPGDWRAMDRSITPRCSLPSCGGAGNRSRGTSRSSTS